MAADTGLDADRCSLIAGPKGDARVDACLLLVELSELQEYVVSDATTVALITPNGDDVWDLWVLDRKGDAYIQTRHEILQREDGVVTVACDNEPTPLTLDEAVELARRATSHDLTSSKRIYESRRCAENDILYPTTHVLVDLERTYADMLEAYEEQPSWFTALMLFQFVELTVLTLGDVALLTITNEIHSDVFRTFADGASEEGEREELDQFVDRIGDVLIDVRKLIQDV